ncbi:MAG: hypothetical protein J5836_01250 [Clostridia bacterium]|nr:hypothetical protein [Clostridia bacterium]
MFGENERDIKKIEFLNSVVKEKTERLSKIEKDLALSRKKNGKTAELDIYIYQANMKIAAVKKEISVCKKEIKALKEKIAEELVVLYAENGAYKDKVNIRELFSKVYEGKAHIVDEYDCKEAVALFGVATKDKKSDGKPALLIKAGINTSMGKVVKKPEIAVYEYTKKLIDGEKITEGYPKEITVGEKKKGFFAGLFKLKK